MHTHNFLYFQLIACLAGLLSIEATRLPLTRHEADISPLMRGTFPVYRKRGFVPSDAVKEPLVRRTWSPDDKSDKSIKPSKIQGRNHLKNRQDSNTSLDPHNYSDIQDSSSSEKPTASDSITPTGSTSSKPGSSVVPLNNLSSRGITFTTEVKVGDTLVPVIVDTGSSQFWVAATRCATCESSHMKVASMPNDANCEIRNQTYGMVSVEGCLVQSDIQVGAFALQNQTIMAASQIDSTFQSQADFMSGILGLGMGSGDFIESPPPLEQLFQNGFIDAPTVGFYLSREESISNSEMTLGDVSKSPHIDLNRSVTLPRVGRDTGHYSVQLDGIKVGNFTLDTGGVAAVDTGSTNLWIPEEQLLPLFGNLNHGEYYKKGEGYAISCEKGEGTTKLSLTFGGQDWEIAYEDLLGPQVVENPKMCYARVDALPPNPHFQYIIGDVFLHNVYSTFNIQEGSVMFNALREGS